MDPSTRREELPVADADEVPWATVAAVAGGVVAMAVGIRLVVAAVRIAVGEARYQAADPDNWFKWLR
jgi:hypothetical protein